METSLELNGLPCLNIIIIIIIIIISELNSEVEYVLYN